MKFISKRAKLKFEDIDVKKVISAETIEEIYKLSSQLEKLENDLSPTGIKRLEKTKEKLHTLLIKGIKGMKDLYEWWINLHSEVDFADPKRVIELAAKEIPFNKNKIINLYNDYISGIPSKYDFIFRNIELKLKKELWATQPFSGILSVFRKLQKGPTGNLGDDNALFHEALTTTHQAGPMINHISDYTNISKDLLDRLSGVKENNSDDQPTKPINKEKVEEALEKAKKYEEERNPILEQIKKERLKKLWEEAEKTRTDMTSDEVLLVAHKTPELYIGNENFEGRFPEFLNIAVESLLNKYPNIYFLDNLHKREDLKKFNNKALMLILSKQPSVYFNKGLFLEPEFSNYNKSAAYATANLEPKFFLDYVLKRFPEFKSLRFIAEQKLNKSAAQIRRISFRQLIPGGLGENLNPSDVDQKQLEMGIKVELEHSGNVDLAQEIALDHLAEDPKYYTKLLKMENE